MSTDTSSLGARQPAATLETRDAVGIIVGLVVGAGIFTLPSLVAKSSTNSWLVMGLWLAGGVLSVIGALCYAELATAYPNAGGDDFFFLLVGISIFILRAREPARHRPFRVPLYPITPLLFCATCAYLLYASLEYAKTGAIAGIGVVVFGFAPLALSHRQQGRALLFALIGILVIGLAFPSVRKLLLG